MRNIRLYIGGKRADLDESTSVPFTFQTTDAEMPTAVKNSYSKTITLQGTDTNRRIFDGLWRLDSLVTDKQQRPPEFIPESTESDAEFTERSVPGVASGDSARVTGVKGKSIVWNQLVETNWFATNTPANVSWTNNGDGSYTINGTASGVGQVVAFTPRKSFGDHKYYLATSDSTIAIYFNGTFFNQGTYTDSRQIVTAQASDTYYPCIRFQSGATFSNKKVYIKIIDLTQMFGSGNEPTSVAEFEALYPLDYYDYNTGQLINNAAAGIEMLSAGGSNLGTFPLDITSLTSGGVQIFPDGMKSAGAAYDEWSGNTAVKRIGVVDLGTLAWDYDGTYKRFLATLTGSKRPADNSLSANMLGAIYTTTNFNAFLGDTTLDKAMTHPFNNDTIQIRNLAYTNAATFTTAMSGVYLYYELATPVTYTTDQPISDTPVPFSTSGKQRRLPQDTASSVLAPFIGSFEYGRIKTYPMPYSFNPMKRVDFQLYVDEMVVERGYCQLAAINRKGRDYTFSVSLFGGLGEFFYNLQTDSDGEKRSLADLDYGSDLGFKINATEVQSNWDTLLGGTLPSIAFVPMHNGVPKTISGDKMLIKGGGLPTSTSDGYTTKSGYLLASLERKYTEWEVGDLRSYLQRPALRVKDFIDAICDPANNGGWKVNLDSDFFDSSNPYYWNTYLLLPQLNVEEETEDICDDGSITPLNDYPTTSTKTKNLTPVSGCLTISSNYVDMSAYASNAYLKLSLPVQLALTGQANVGNLYMTNRVSHHTENKTICVMAVAWDEDGNMVGVSNRYVFTSKSHRNETGDVKKPSAPYPTTDAQIDGYFAYSGGEYKFRLDDYNSDTFALTIDKIQRPSSALHKVRVDFYIQMTTEGIPTLNKYRRGDNVDNVYVSNTQFDVRILSGSNNTLTLVEPTQYATDSQVSQDSLFGALEATPLEILLSYTKRFGLMWIQENSEKEVSVFARKNYYTGEVKDIHNLIDYSKGLKVTPVAAESNNYVLGDKETESTLAEAYLSRYGRNYGEVRLKVGYDFGKEKVEMMEKCEFTEVVDGALSGSGYWAYHNADGNLPSAIADGMKVTYYKESGGTTDTKDLDYNLFNVTGIEKKNSPALGCASKTDDGEETAEEVAPALVFFQGGKVDGTWHLTDDNTAMALLNNSPCWLWDESLSAARVPRFGRVATFSGETYSLDFGTPRETFYIPEVSLAPEQAIYARWWERYLIDLLSKDTKKAECYVVFPPHLDMRHEMRKFYLFDRSLWVLNKVTDYDATKVQPVKCEFIRVTDKEAYTSY